MYESFYNLKEKPFSLTPSPKFVYLSEGHKEALSLLKYGVMERMGFILLTGEVGTGKTTMVRTLLDSLDNSVKYVHLSNPILSPEDLFKYLAASTFKKEVQFNSKAHFLLVFQAYLKQALKDQTNFVFIIDEAHKLSFELLEEIRLLSNMETGDEKLINIFLVGQPELNKNLSAPVCRALLQRISIRYHIPPLNSKETGDYLASRLKVAGAKNPNHIFSKRAVEAIHNSSRGFPREINVLADNTLLLGYAKGVKKITPSMVAECYEDLRIEDSFTKKEPRKTGSEEIKKTESFKKSTTWRWAAVLLLCLMFFLGALSLSGKRIFSRFVDAAPSTYKRVTGIFLKNPVAQGIETGGEPEGIGGTHSEKVQQLIDGKNGNESPENVGTAKAPSVEKVAGEALPAEEIEYTDLTATTTAPEKPQKARYGKDKNEIPEKARIAKAFIVEETVSEELRTEETEYKDPTPANIAPEKPQKERHDKNKNEMAEKVEVVKPLNAEKPAKESDVAENTKRKEPIDQEKSLPSPRDRDPSETTRVVKEGDTLTILALEVYGKADEKILEQVHKHNPGIKDIDWIYAGQKIVFPPLSVSNDTAMFTVHIASYKPFEPAFEMFQNLMKAGYEVHMMPVNNPDRGMIFRLTLGAFESLREAEGYAKTIMNGGVSEYAKAVQLDVK